MNRMLSVNTRYALLLTLTTAGCLEEQKNDGSDPIRSGAVADPELGSMDFISADGYVGQDSGDANGRLAGGGSDGGDGGALAEGAPQPAADPDGEGTGARGGNATVEEGDIYRVLGNGLLLNLNSFRGLQVIDISDPENPEIIGRHRVTGEPVEMYAFDDRAIVLINNWTGYYGVRGAALPNQYTGGLVLDIDLSDPRRPVIADRAQVPGHIRKSRLVRQGDDAALYVVADESGAIELDNGDWQWHSSTVAKSFRLSGGGLEARSELDLGGNIVDIQATPEVLMIARTDWERGGGRSQVGLVDISSPNGDMVEGGDVMVRGQINNQFNMDFYNNVLRVVSDGRFTGDNINHVETFDATDLNVPEAIDHATFGRDENLFATLFVGNKAFFVTFRRTDPFHAFSIDDDGNIEERAEFIVTGWNDFFRPTMNASRLIGIGMGDDRGNSQAVSLYDISDLDNAEPLIARAGVDARNTWSEAQYDHRAFSVLEGVTEIDGPDGAVETGMVLLPFSGWDGEGDRHRSGVQIFTFSASSLTARGVMEHGTPVRRSFQAAAGLAGNLSEVSLSLFDISDPEEPSEQGRVELSPAYSDFIPFGDHGVRLKDTSAEWSWWANPQRAAQPPAIIEVVDLAADGDSADPDSAEALATIEAPAGARIFQVNDSVLAVVTSRYQSKQQSPEGPTLETIISLYDLSDGANPVELGSLTTTQIPGDGQGRRGGGPDIGMAEPMWEGDMEMGRFWYGAANTDVRVAGDSLTFIERRHQERRLGEERICTSWPEEQFDRDCDDGGVMVDEPAMGAGSAPSPAPTPPDGGCNAEECDDDGGEGDDEAGDRRKHDGGDDGECSWLQGGITCRSLDGAPEVCEGRVQRCGEHDGQWLCEDADMAHVEMRRECWTNELYRYWQSFALHVVDLSDPAAPVLIDPIELDDAWEAVSVVAEGDSVYATWRAPVEVEGDARAFVRYHYSRVDLSNPSEPRVIEPVNIPGELLAVGGDDGATLFTRDQIFGEDVIETAVNRLTLTPRGARLDARRRFEDRFVDSVALDGRGRLLVSHRQAWHDDMEGDVLVGIDIGRSGGGAGPPSRGGAGVPATNTTEPANDPAEEPEDGQDDEGGEPPPFETKKSALEHEGQHLSVLDASADGGLAILSQVPIADWAQLRTAAGGKALFSVGGGLLVVDLSDPAAPEAQAYFPTRGWPTRIHVEGDEAYVPAGRYGVYRFDLNVRNLLVIE